MKKMYILKKRELVGVLLSFLLISCEDALTSSESDSSTEKLYFNMRLPVDGNGYYHLTIDRNTWQTLHRVSGKVTTKDDNPIEFFWVEWESDLYWYLGDTLGYIVHRGLTDDMVYVSYDTTYITGFSGMEVSTSNMVSYSNSNGEINNMIAPVRSMIGDTLTLTAIWYNSEKRFGIVLD